MISQHEGKSTLVHTYDLEDLLDAEYVWFFGQSTTRPTWFRHRTEFVNPHDLYEGL